MRLPVTLLPTASSALVGVLATAHALVWGGLLAAGLGANWLALAGFLLAASLAVQLRAQVLRPAWSMLILRADGRLDMERRDGHRGEAEVLSGSTVFPWLVVLRLRADGRRYALTLLPDGLAGDGHRALRLWLRWRAGVPA